MLIILIVDTEVLVVLIVKHYIDKIVSIIIF